MYIVYRFLTFLTSLYRRYVEIQNVHARRKKRDEKNVTIVYKFDDIGDVRDQEGTTALHVRLIHRKEE